MSLFSRERSFTRNVAVVLIGSFLILEGAPAVAAAAEAAPPTNFEIVKSACVEAASEIVKDISRDVGAGRVVLVKAKGANDADFLFDNALVERLREQGIAAAIDTRKTDEPSPGADAEYTLQYQIVRLGVKYPRIARRWWFGSKMVERAVNADVTAQLVNRKTGDVLWIREGSGAYSDAIVYSQLGAVEEKQYEFTRPTRTEFRMSRIVEPVVVSGIVVALVYLFFSNQSNE